MESFFINLFQSNPAIWQHWGYLIIFLVSVIESILFIGIFIPGQIIIILAGFLVKTGIFKFSTALLFSALGAAIGDIIGFFIGKHYKDKIPEFVFSFVKKPYIEKTQKLIEHHSVKSIFIGRLHSMTRTFSPFIAGTTSISLKKFVFADIGAAFIWAYLSLLIGYIFGKSFELAAAKIGKYIMIATLVTISLIFIAKSFRDHRKRVPIFDWALYTTGAISTYMFAIISQDISTNKLLHILDIRSIQIFNELRSPFSDQVALLFTRLGNPTPMLIVVLSVVGLLLYKKRIADSIFFLLSSSIGLAILDFLKATFRQPRPSPQLIEVYGSSFPSGHAMMSVVIFGLISYSIIRSLNNQNIKDILYYGVVIISVGIGLSRVYLNVHWASDVLAGYFAGIAYVSLSIAIYRLMMWTIDKSRKKHKIPNLQ